MAQEDTGLSIGMPGRKLNPVASVKQHKLMAASIAAFIALLGIPLGWKIGTPTYEVKAVVHVSPRFMKNLDDDKELEFQSNTQFLQFIQQQKYTINRYDIVSEALHRLGTRRSLWQKPNETDSRAAVRLQGALGINPIRKSYLITVGLAGPDKEGLAPVVNSVVETYLSKAKQEEFFASDERIGHLKKKRRGLNITIQEKMGRQKQLATRFGTTSFNPSQTNPYDALLMSSREALEGAQREKIKAAAEFGAVDRFQRAEGVEALAAQARSLVNRDPGLTSLKANLNKRRGELHAKLNALGSSHPGRKVIRSEFAAINRTLKKTTGLLLALNKRQHLATLKAELYKAQWVEKGLSDQVKQLQSQASTYAALFQEGVAVGRELEELHQELTRVNGRISFLQLEVTAPGFLRLVSPARTPDLPKKGGRKKIILLFMVAGTVFGCLVPVVVDFLDNHVKGVEELEGLLGFPPVGWIPEFSDSRDEAYMEIGSDRLRRIAIAFVAEKKSKGLSTVAFTSATACGGTTTVLWNLAQEFRQLGFATIIVEANMLSRDERYAQVARSKGLVEVMYGETSLQEVIVPGTHDAPPLVPLGDSTRVRFLSDAGDLKEIFTSLVQEYQVVLVDMPPATHSPDGEFICREVEAVFLVVQDHTVTGEEVRSAAKLLEHVSPPLVGTILNRVKLHDLTPSLREEWERTVFPQWKMVKSWVPSLKRKNNDSPAPRIHPS